MSPLEGYRWVSLHRTHQYYDQDKLTPAMELLYGRALEEIEFGAAQGRPALYQAVARQGAALAWLGLDLEAGEPSWSEISPYLQVNALMAYCLQRKSLPAIDLDSGREVWFDRTFGSSGSGPIARRESLGVINGLVIVRPFSPAPDSDLAADVFSDQKRLWLAETPERSPVRLRMPLWNQGFTRSDSVARLLPDQPGQTVRMEAVGFLDWQDETLVCEPLAIALVREP